MARTKIAATFRSKITAADVTWYRKIQKEESRWSGQCVIIRSRNKRETEENMGRDFFYRCTVHSDIRRVHSPTNALLLV